MRTAASPGIDLEHAESLARLLLGAVMARRIYAEDHDRVETSLRTLARALDTSLREESVRNFRITAASGVLSYSGIPLGSRRGGMGQLAQLLEQRACGGLVFHPGVGHIGLAGLVTWLADRDPRPTVRSYAGIDVLAQGAEDEDPAADAESEALDALVPEFRVPNRIHKSAHSVLQHIMEDLQSARQLDFGEVLELTQWTAEMANSYGNQLIAATQLARHDNYTFNHSVNVFLIATTLLQPFATDREQLARYAQAALLHDVGKSRIPREILFKKDRLTEDEFAQMRRHPEYGAEILHSCQHTDSLAVEVAYCHHMRDDGYGYPNPVLPVKSGPVVAVVQISDMFEALTAHRPYHRGMATAEAISTIVRTAGMKSKRHAIALLLQRLTNSPPGSQVRLRTGERGLVLQTYPEAPDRPLVRIFESSAGVAIREPYEVDLKEQPEELNGIAEVFLKPSLTRTGHNPSDAIKRVRS